MKRCWRDPEPLLLCNHFHQRFAAVDCFDDRSKNRNKAAHQFIVCRISDTQPDHRWSAGARGAQNGKVPVFCNQRRRTLYRFAPNLPDACSQQTDIGYMRRVMPQFQKTFGKAWRQLRIDQEAHGYSAAITGWSD